MTNDEAIFAALTQNPDVKSHVGRKVFPLNARQGEVAPFIIYQKTAEEPGSTHNEPAGANLAYYTISVFAPTFERAVNIRSAVIAALDNVELDNGETPALEGTRDDYDGEPPLYRADADFIL